MKSIREDSEGTRARYPFRFRLFLGYRLPKRELRVLRKVENREEEKLYFFIGGILPLCVP